MPFFISISQTIYMKLFFNKLKKQLLLNKVLGIPKKVKVFLICGPKAELFRIKNNEECNN